MLSNPYEYGVCKFEMFLGVNREGWPELNTILHRITVEILHISWFLAQISMNDRRDGRQHVSFRRGPKDLDMKA